MICFVLQIRWVAAIDIPKCTPIIMESLCFEAQKKLDGSTGLVEFFFTAMLRLIARNIGDKVFDSEGTLFQRLGTTLKTCKMEFA